MLYKSTGDPAILALAEKLYGELVSSADFLIYGGVLEYFGMKYDRDEGCSQADFLRLSLQLWQATGNLDYLERAERCMLNIFYAGQFETGDFGHRRFDETGYIPALGAGRAWWPESARSLVVSRVHVTMGSTDNIEALSAAAHSAEGAPSQPQRPNG